MPTWKWVIEFFNKPQNIHIGSKIKTKFGEGTIVGGTLRIKYGKSPSKIPCQGNNLQWSHNLEEFTKESK